MSKKKTSLTFRLLKKMGYYYSEEEYGNITLWIVIKRVYKTYRDAFLLKFVMDSWLLSPIAVRKSRPWVLKKVGCHVGKNIGIGDHVIIDAGHADMIYIEDYVQLSGGSRLLCHKRDLSDYHKGDNAADFGYIKGSIVLKKGCQIGMDTMIVPGVTVGEGAIVGAGSLVAKDIPAWTVALGRPAKVIREIPNRPVE